MMCVEITDMENHVRLQVSARIQFWCVWTVFEALEDCVKLAEEKLQNTVATCNLMHKGYIDNYQTR